MRVKLGFLDGGNHYVVSGEVVVEFGAVTADAIDVELKNIEGLCGR